MLVKTALLKKEHNYHRDGVLLSSQRVTKHLLTCVYFHLGG